MRFSNIFTNECGCLHYVESKHCTNNLVPGACAVDLVGHGRGWVLIICGSINNLKNWGKLPHPEF